MANLSVYQNKEGLESNGSIKLYFGGKEHDYGLRNISYRLLDGDNEGIAIAAYNDPRTLHCLSNNQQAETFAILEHAKRDDRVKVLIWTATGTKAFGSGAAMGGDMNVYLPEACVDEYSERGMMPGAKAPGNMVLREQTLAFWDFPKPLILAINGLAVGGAANIALANYGDLVLCSSNARFKWPFAKLGLTPELGSSLLIPFLVGMPKAKEFMMTGRWVSAEEALSLGLCNEVVAPELLLPRCLEVARGMTDKHPTTMKLIKWVMNKPLREKLEEILTREDETIKESFSASGGMAFKRKPRRKGNGKSKL